VPVDIINKMTGGWKRCLSVNVSRHVCVTIVRLLSSFQDKNLGESAWFS